MEKKKKIIIISIIIVLIILIGVFIGICINKKLRDNKTAKTEISKERSIESLTDVEKRIAGIDTNNSEDIKEKNYSESYKDYLKVTKGREDKGEVIPRKQNVPIEKLEEIKKELEEDNSNEDNNAIPARFNLAEQIDIKVEDQKSFGLCWDFASIKPLETYLALNNLGNYDFSEMHLDYIESELFYGNRKIHQGGNFNNFKNYIVESGVVLENEVPYRDHTEEEYNKFLDIKKAIEVTETVDFPSIYKDEIDRNTEEEIAEFRETVKKHLMKNGGLYCVIATPDDFTEYFNMSNNAECFLGDSSNLHKGREFHAVTIVGWDDNYSKENFNESMRPTKDGAYILLNSWGPYWGDPFNGKNGYFYVSYEDKYVETSLSGIISTSMDNAYKINSIKNPVIKDYLIENYEPLFVEYEGEKYITKNVISNIYSLDLSNKNITSLEDIEIFTNLYDLNLSNNNLKDITPLARLTSLSYLDLSNNNIKDISCFKNMKSKSLYYINLSNNKIKDVSVLANIDLDEWNALDLDISNNPNIKGYEKIRELAALNISDCNIKDVSNLKKCQYLNNLNVSNSNGIKGLEQLPENIYDLNISNCNIETIPELPRNIAYLNISENNLTTLDKIQNLKYLYSLDVSGNAITDWSALKEITKEEYIQEEYYEENIDYDIDVDEDYFDYEFSGIYINADNCNIEDITIFNDLSFWSDLSIKDNKIKDVSQFHNDKVYSIDLSNNEDLTGLQAFSKVLVLYLNNCNISNISEILKLENIYALSLENNNITDITDFSKLKNLSNLSLAGNKELKGTISSNSIYNLNVRDCNLDENFDFSKIQNLSYLNISENPRISNLENIAQNINSEFITIILDELDLYEFERIQEKYDKKSFYFENVTLNLNYKLADNTNLIDLSQNKVLKHELMRSIAKGQINIENGHINKKGDLISIEDTSKDSVEIKFLGWSSIFGNSTIKIIFNKNANETDESNSNTNTKVIKNSTKTEKTNTDNDEENNIDTENVIENNTIEEINNANNQNVLYNFIYD